MKNSQLSGGGGGVGAAREEKKVALLKAQTPWLAWENVKEPHNI